MNKEEIKKNMQEFVQKVDNDSNIILIKEKKPKIKTENSKHPEYFEGQLQMRNINQEILNYVQKRITNAKENVPTVVHHSEYNIDYSVSSRKLIHQIGVELKNKFGGTVKEAAQLFSHDNLSSKNIYRLNVLYKAHEYEKNDIVEIENLDEPYKITGFNKDRLILCSIKSNKKTHISPNLIVKKETQFKSKILTVKPNITVMDENFQSAIIKNFENKELKEGQNVKYVKFKNEFWLV